MGKGEVYEEHWRNSGEPYPYKSHIETPVIKKERV